ncbi:hypothetical protein D3C74_333110 [compost metagenome]
MFSSVQTKNAPDLLVLRANMRQGGQTQNASALPGKCSGVLTLLVMMMPIQYDSYAVHEHQILSRLDYSTL